MYSKQQLDSRPAVWRIEQASIKSKERKTVAQLWIIGKTKVVNMLQAGRQLLKLENSDAALVGVVFSTENTESSRALVHLETRRPGKAT